MRQLNGLYTQRFNRAHERVGHILQGRYGAVLVERDAHLLELARYVVLNPVRAGLIAEAEDYPWSSLRATLGLEPAPEWLETDALLARFGSRRRYLEFVREGVGRPSPWGASEEVLGSDGFIERLAERIDHRAGEIEFPRKERLIHREPVGPSSPRRWRQTADSATGASASWCSRADTRRPRLAATSVCATRRSAGSRRSGTTARPRRAPTRPRWRIQDSRSRPPEVSCGGAVPLLRRGRVTSRTRSAPRAAPT